MLEPKLEKNYFTLKKGKGVRRKIISNIATHVFRGIPNIYTWMVLWNCRVLDTLNFSMYWASNAMFPYPNAFAFSENMILFTPFMADCCDNLPPFEEFQNQPLCSANRYFDLFILSMGTEDVFTGPFSYARHNVASTDRIGQLQILANRQKKI